MRNLDRALERLGRTDDADPPAPPARQWPYWAAIALLGAAVLALILG